MAISNCIYHHGDLELHGYLTSADQTLAPKPAVIVIHDWSGRNDFACQKADLIANLGYIGFAADMYGLGRIGETTEAKLAFMQPLIQNRFLLRSRVQAALDTLSLMPQVDQQRIAVIGFCFGGLCALDLARSGAKISGVVSFHGLLNKPSDIPNQTIHAKILALHGYQDPMVQPEQVHAFCQEMTEAEIDWQIHMYGQIKHAFTNPSAHDLDAGLIYNRVATQRAIQSMVHFLEEVFA